MMCYIMNLTELLISFIKNTREDITMRIYKLLEGSYSYDRNVEKGENNLYTQDDVIFWAYDVANMIMDESEDNERIVVDNIDSALDVLESANEYFELVTNIK